MSRWFAGLLCSAHMRAHTHTQIQIRTCMLDPVTLALSPIYLFHYTSLGRTMPLCELRGCLCVWVCPLEQERKIQGSVNEVTNRASEVVIWKADDSFTHSFLWIIAIHLSASLYSGRIACNTGIVFMLHHCLSACVQEIKLGTFGQGRVSKIWLVQRLVSDTTNKSKQQKWIGSWKNGCLLLIRIWVFFKKKINFLCSRKISLLKYFNSIDVGNYLLHINPFTFCITCATFEVVLQWLIAFRSIEQFLYVWDLRNILKL